MTFLWGFWHCAASGQMEQIALEITTFFAENTSKNNTSWIKIHQSGIWVGGGSIISRRLNICHRIGQEVMGCVVSYRARKIRCDDNVGHCKGLDVGSTWFDNNDYIWGMELQNSGELSSMGPGENWLLEHFGKWWCDLLRCTQLPAKHRFAWVCKLGQPFDCSRSWWASWWMFFHLIVLPHCWI